MNSTNLLIDKFKLVKGLRNDRTAAIELGITHATVSGWRHGKSHANPIQAEIMAKACNLNVLCVLAAIESDRAISREVQKIWSRFGKGAFMSLAISSSMLSVDAKAAERGEMQNITPHYAKYGRKRVIRGKHRKLQPVCQQWTESTRRNRKPAKKKPMRVYSGSKSKA